MASATRERPIPDSDSSPLRPWVGEPDPPDVDVILVVHVKQVVQPEEETPTEPGYGHGV